MSPCNPWKSADLWDWIEKSRVKIMQLCKLGSQGSSFWPLAFVTSALEGDSTSSVGKGYSTNFNL